jgi:transposase
MGRTHREDKALESICENGDGVLEEDFIASVPDGTCQTEISVPDPTEPRAQECVVQATAELADVRVSEKPRRFSQPRWTEDAPQWRALDCQLPLDHKARLIRAFVDQIDLSELKGVYRGSGSEAYLPDLMLKIAVYETLEGNRSPASWARQLRESIPLQWLALGIQPSRSALYAFRDRLGHVIDPVCADVVGKARNEGLVEGEQGVQDGTTVRAYASRHRALNQARLQKRLEALQDAVERDGNGQPPPEPPAWMGVTADGRHRQLQRYLEAQPVLERRVAENARKPKDRRLGPSKVMVSVSDPEAPMGRDKEKVFCPLYTIQFIVEPSSLLIITFDVFAQATDAGTLPPMLDRANETLGHFLKTIIADATYVSILDLQACAQRQAELIAPVHENDYSRAQNGAAGTTTGKVSTPAKVSAGAKPAIGKDQFTWQPTEQTYHCPQGHRLRHIRQQRRARRQGDSVVLHQFQCPAEYCRECPLRARCVKDPGKGRIVTRVDGEEFLEEHRRRMETPEAKLLRKLRGQVIERSFGDAKAHRGLRKLHGCGRLRAKAEVGLVVLAQNALTLHRLRQNAVKPDAVAA